MAEATLVESNVDSMRSVSSLSWIPIPTAMGGGRGGGRGRGEGGGGRGRGGRGEGGGEQGVRAYSSSI